jgi:4-aminobutyrate aminotransferase/(S)-3-amino-2-methylpropionate transaminase
VNAFDWYDDGKKTYYHDRSRFPTAYTAWNSPYLYRAHKGYTEAEAIAYYLNRLQMVFEETCPPEEVAVNCS